MCVCVKCICLYGYVHMCVCGRCICSCGYVYHMCVGMVGLYVYVGMCTFVHTCVEVFPNCSSSSFILRHGLSLNLKLTDAAKLTGH